MLPLQSAKGAIDPPRSSAGSGIFEWQSAQEEAAGNEISAPAAATAGVQFASTATAKPDATTERRATVWDCFLNISS